MVRMMFKQFARSGVDPADIAGANLAGSGELDALVALEQIGVRRSFTRDEEIYADGDRSDFWFRVVSGTVRICKLLPDGRRHLAEFCLAGDSFGMDNAGERGVSAEAVGEVGVMRYPRRATERLPDQRPELARRLRAATSRDLAHAQSR